MKNNSFFGKSLMSLFSTVISVLTFGTIKLNKFIKSEYDIEFLKLKLEQFNMTRRETLEKQLATIEIQSAANYNEKKIKTNISNVIKKLNKAKENNDTLEFTKLAAQLETLKIQLESCQTDIKSCQGTLDLIEKSLFQLDLMIEKYKGEISIAESYKMNATIKKSMNDVASELYFDSQINDSLSADNVKNYYDEENVKEDARTEFLKRQIPAIETSTFNTAEDMENYLNSLSEIK